METMKKGVNVGTVIHMTWRNCMRGFCWCHNTDILIYLICGKGLQANPIQCTLYICGKGVQTNSVKSSGLCGDLSLLADGFRCKRCDGTIQETDLAGGLVVDG